MKFRWIALIIVVIICLWFGSGWIIHKVWDENTRGSIGDMFGAINALFAGLAFAGLIITIALQRRDLEIQRKAIEMQTEELKMQREEMARSADHLESQQKLMNFQITLTTMNELIQLKNKRINHVGMKIDGEDVMGVKALASLVRRNREINRPITSDNPVLQNYYNSFFYILQYVSSSSIDTEQKKVLASILNIDTSDAEIFILYKAFGNDANRFNLMNEFNFYERYNKMLENE